MKRLFTFLLLGAMISPVAAQEVDQEGLAKEILSELSEEAKTYKTVTIDFSLTIKTTQGKTIQNGKAKAKGSQFYYETEDRKVYSDGKAVWTFLEEEEECYIDNLEDLDGGINPSEILTIWENNFKAKYDKEISADVHQIKLYPMDTEKSKYHTVTITVNRKTKKVEKAIIKTKENATVIMNFNSITPNKEIPDSDLKWNPAKHGNPDVIDNRM
jgi:outer membrane lipoprotein-sorting protein